MTYCDLGPDHAAGELELRVLRQAVRELVDDPVVLPREQRLDRRQRDVLVRTYVTGDDCIRGGPRQRAHQVHRRCGGHVVARIGAGQVVAREEQTGALAQPVAPGRGDAVDLRRVDETAERVDLLPWRPDPRRAGEVELPGLVRELLERVFLVVCDRRALGRRLVTESDVVIDELAPCPSPLRDLVLGEHVLTDVVEDAVGDVARIGTGDHRADAVAVVRRGDARVGGAGHSPGGVLEIVAAPVECSRRLR